MLKQLSVSNYALIEHIDVSFNKGLTIITGETGAGKSILLGALGLILGERADSTALRDENKKCIVEGIFGVGEYDLAGFFAENELDYDVVTTLRREIAPGGKSRAFINDTPVNLAVLKELAEKLIDIHSQHETRLLNNPDFQLGLLDVYAGNFLLKAEYKKIFQAYISSRNHRSQLLEKFESALLNQSFLDFQYNELEAAKITNTGELEEVESQLNILTHVELIKQSLADTYELLENNESNAIQQLQTAKSQLQRSLSYDSRLQEKLSRLEACIIELKDISAECGQLNESLEFDAEKLSRLSSRADLLNKLLSKHRVSTLEELIAIRNETGEKLSSINTSDAELKELDGQIGKYEQELDQLADKLSASRFGIISTVCEKVNSLLIDLGMPHAELKVLLSQGTLRNNGKDEVKFLIRTNKGTDFQPIDKIASGGELSRIMLCLKAVNAEKNIMPTIIFDEIDTGISGEIASKMGNVLKQLGTRMQVISISHLPQIAGKGDAHFKVSKRIDGQATFSHIEVLNPEERVREIAAMISGSEITEAAIENARFLLRN